MPTSNRRVLLQLGLLMLVLLFAGPPAPRSGETLRTASVPFEENLGQAGGEVAFIARSANVTIEVMQRSVSLAMPWPEHESCSVEFLGSEPGALPQVSEPLPGRVHHLPGPDPSGWQRNVRTFPFIEWDALYPGVNLSLRTDHDALVYRFDVAPGVEPDTIFLGIPGARHSDHEGRDTLVIDGPAGEVRLRLAVTQRVDAAEKSIGGTFRLIGRDALAIIPDDHDADRPLNISLTQTWSVNGIAPIPTPEPAVVALADDGTVWVASATPATRRVDEPAPADVPSRADGALDRVDIVLTALPADMSGPLSTIHIGGSGEDRLRALAIDRDGTIVLAGSTSSRDFPASAGQQHQLHGPTDGFVMRLGDDGTRLQQAVLIGGRSGDAVHGVAFGRDGSLWILGRTEGDGLPISPGANQPFPGGGADAFVARLEPGQASPTYIFYLGGSGDDEAAAIALDADGVYLTGTTSSVDFPASIRPIGTSGGASRSQPGDGAPRQQDLFVVKLDVRSGVPIYATRLGEEGLDSGLTIAIDPQGRAYVAGSTT